MPGPWCSTAYRSQELAKLSLALTQVTMEKARVVQRKVKILPVRHNRTGKATPCHLLHFSRVMQLKGESCSVTRICISRNSRITVPCCKAPNPAALEAYHKHPAAQPPLALTASQASRPSRMIKPLQCVAAHQKTESPEPFFVKVLGLMIANICTLYLCHINQFHCCLSPFMSILIFFLFAFCLMFSIILICACSL